MKNLSLLLYIIASGMAVMVTFKLPTGACDKNGINCFSYTEAFFGVSSAIFACIGIGLLIFFIVKNNF